jgi:cellulose synthase/poly-beta-1,6-N-acetylglucosamine synthase-like glycosyltransferase
VGARWRFRDRDKRAALEDVDSTAIGREAALVVVRICLRHGTVFVIDAPSEGTGATVEDLDESRRVLLGLRAHRTSILAALVMVTLAAVAVTFPIATLETSLAVLFAFLAGVGVATLSLMLYAWRDGESLQAMAFPAAREQPTLTFSLILPARHEEKVLGATVRQLVRQDYPDFEVVVVVGHDDPGTHRVAHRAIGMDPRFRVVVDEHADKNKPKALNTALPYCRGDVVGVFDAEDLVATGLLRAVDAGFAETGADVVQGATQLVNHHSSWFAAHNVLEYYFWFKSRLHLHSRVGFIPLGGNTVFVRRAWLLAAKGWDENCLAEDCDLGARLSACGARTAVLYAAELATREETPESVAALVRQRTRWSQGFLQVLRKGDWRTLPWRARALAVYTLAFPFLQAATCLLLPLTIVAAIFLQLPIELALLSVVPVVPLFAILAVEIAGLESLSAEFGLNVRVRDYVRLVLSAVPYQVLLGIAAGRAAWRELRGIRTWEKTVHVGAHL